MAFPAAIYGTLTDTYLTLPGNGMTLGMEIEDPNSGLRYRLVRSAAAIAANKSIKSDPSQTNPDVVIATAAAGDAVYGINDTAGAIPDALRYFWAKVHGATEVLVKTGVANGNLLVPSSTSGVLDAASSSAANQMIRVTANDANASGVDAVIAAFIN